MRPSFDPKPLLDLARLKAADDGWHTDEAMRHHVDNDARVAEVCGVSRRTVSRWKLGGRMDVPSADKAAINLGLHPCLIWDDWWDA
jgi:transcriptional regulator with XRE-family HTH domain